MFRSVLNSYCCSFGPFVPNYQGMFCFNSIQIRFIPFLTNNHYINILSQKNKRICYVWSPLEQNGLITSNSPIMRSEKKRHICRDVEQIWVALGQFFNLLHNVISGKKNILYVLLPTRSFQYIYHVLLMFYPTCQTVSCGDKYSWNWKNKTNFWTYCE